jgi:hypothetical protein
LLAPRKPIGGGVKPAVSSRIQSRPAGSKIGGAKIGGAKTTPPKKVTKSAAKASSGPTAAVSASNAAELKALQEQVKQLEDQVSSSLSFCFLSCYLCYNFF